MMRPTPKFSICLVAISVSCFGLLFVFCNSVWPQEAKKANPRTKELQQQRLAVLEQIRDTSKKLFESARVGFEEVHDAERELLAARLTYADTQDDRIKVCDEAVKEALQYLSLVKGKAASAQVSHVVELKAQAFLLETQITRANAETDK
jgi:hypothetical protein